METALRSTFGMIGGGVVDFNPALNIAEYVMADENKNKAYLPQQMQEDPEALALLLQERREEVMRRINEAEYVDPSLIQEREVHMLNEKPIDIARAEREANLNPVQRRGMIRRNVSF